MAGILDWLKQRTGLWGSDYLARKELGRERVRVRTGAGSGRFTFLPYLDNVTGESEAHRREYPKMLRESAIKAAILDKVLSVAALDHACNPGGEGPNDKPAAEFGKHYVNQIRATDWDVAGLPAFCETVILPGLITGYSVSEKFWKLEERGRWAGKLCLRLKSKFPGQHVELEVDEYNNVTAIVGRGAATGQRFEPHQFVIWRHLPLWDNPAGTSDLRAAYRAFFCIDTCTKLRMIFLEKFAAGPMAKGTYSSTDQLPELEDSLKAAAANTWIAIPEGTQVELVDVAMRGTDSFDKAISDFREEVLLGVSGATLQALTSGPGDPRGSSAVHKDTADLRKWHISACVTSLLNIQVLPDATDLNFPAGTNVPELSLGGVDDSEMTQSLAVDKGLGELGVELSKADLRERYGRPEPKDEADMARPVIGGAMPLVDPLTGEPPPEQAGAVAGTDLRSTVGGLQAIAALQQQYYASQLPREAAISNVMLLFGFTQEEASELFPSIAPNAPQAADPNAMPAAGATEPQPGVQLAEPQPLSPDNPPPQPTIDLDELAAAFFRAKAKAQ